MNTKQNKPLKIFLRLTNGWSDPVENIDEECCDIDGAMLWIGPGGQVYCDLVHNPDEKITSQGH
jgi:hypothetical protein